MKLIAFTGAAGSGKDTAAGVLIRQHGYKKLSFAGVLKDAVAAVFSWPRHLLEGDTEESRVWREQEDPWWSERLGRLVTPRLMLQEWGTDVCRIGFHADIWVAAVEKILATASPHSKYVITDCRFENECAMIRRYGGLIVHIRRISSTSDTPAHVSEAGLPRDMIDHVIDNDRCLEAFLLAVYELVTRQDVT
jgi:hypothetical protein